jgi:nucleoid DNA-binding protein
MRGSEFSQAVAGATNMTPKQINAVFRAASEILKARLLAGDTVKLHMLGTAYVVSYPSRWHYNNLSRQRTRLNATKKARFAFAGHIQNRVKPPGI